MSYFKDSKDLITESFNFVKDFVKTFFYFAFSCVQGVYFMLKSIFFKYVPTITRELKSNVIEFLYIMNGIFYVFAYETANILSNFFVVLGKGCYSLADQFDRLARYLFPKSFGKMGRG